MTKNNAAIKEILEYCSISVFESSTGYDLLISCQDDIWILIAEHYSIFVDFLRSNELETAKFEPSRIKIIILISNQTPSRIVAFEVKKIKINILNSIVKISGLFLIFFQMKIKSFLDWIKSLCDYDEIS